MTIDENDLNEILDEDDDDQRNDKYPSIPHFILDVIKNKSEVLNNTLKFLSEMYKIVDDEIKKKEIYLYMKDNIIKTKNTIDQFDYLIAMMEDHENEEKSDNEDT